MATTGTVVQSLIVGIRTSAGAALASGKARFYQPGTTVAQTVYSDDACTAAITQPLTLDAGGRGVVFTKNPVRLFVKDSTDVTTIVDDVIVTRAEQVFITNALVNSGAETDLNTYLTTVGTSMGATFQYRESSTASLRNYVDVLGERLVSIADFGAVGDGVTDDAAAINAAIQRVKARGGGVVFIPAKTYLCSTAITNDGLGVSIVGTGRGSILKFTSGSANGIVVNRGTTGDSFLVLRDFAITHATTSSGTGITFTNGNRTLIQGVAVGLFRFGIDTAAVSDCKLVDCNVTSTDGNALACGILLGTRCRAVDCDAVSLSTAGTGLALGTDATATGTYITNFTTGALLSGARSRLVNATVTAVTGVSVTGAATLTQASYFASATSGVSIAGTTATVRDCYFDASTTGVVVANSGANRAHITGCEFNTCATGVNNIGGDYLRILDNEFVSCTLGIDVKSGATTLNSVLFRQNHFVSCTADYGYSAGGGSVLSLNRRDNYFGNATPPAASVIGWSNANAGLDFHFTYDAAVIVSSTGTQSFTPIPGAGYTKLVSARLTGGGATTLNINNTVTSGLAQGQTLIIVVANETSPTAACTVSFTGTGTQYKATSTSATLSKSVTLSATGSVLSAWFRWDGSGWILMSIGQT